MISHQIGDLKSSIGARRLPSLTGLRCFEMAARLESFSRAADALGLTPGAVSRAVRLLEQELDIVLFERRSRRVFLTESGHFLADAVQQGFATIATATQQLRDSKKDQGLMVSCEPTLMMRWLIPRLPDFQARHPDIVIHLVAGGGELSFDSGLDLAIRRDDFARPQHFHTVTLFPEAIGPVCRPDRLDHFFEKGPSSEWRFRSNSLLLHSKTRPESWATWQRLCVCPIETPRRQEFEHFYFSLQAAIAGVGIAIGPIRLVQDDIESGALAAPFGFIKDGSDYVLLAPAAIKPATPAASFCDWLSGIAL